jgi:hypothetical protein
MKEPLFSEFVDVVDLHEYPNYSSGICLLLLLMLIVTTTTAIAQPISLKMIQERLMNNFYHSLLHLLNDIDLVLLM